MVQPNNSVYRSHNFSAGPTVLPTSVLQQAREEFLDYRGTGSSIMELSHRGAEYIEVDAQARERISKLLQLGDDYEVLFLQGGASTQFMMLPCNFLEKEQTADYLNTGAWAKKAITEARLFGNVNVAYSSEEDAYRSLPRKGEVRVSNEARYLHFTSNNTIYGTQFREEPESGDVPLACDASSDFMSRPIDIKHYGVLYAGAQKNAGPAGVTVVILRKDFLEKAKVEGISTILQYRTHVGTMFNTPPVFAVYMLNLVMGWLQEKGGLSAIDRQNREKAGWLYEEIDRDDFYRGTVEKESRSLMNVPFRLHDSDLEKTFVKEAEAVGLHGLKGHRSVGGMRASIYNACPPASVRALVEFMGDFRRRNG